MHLSYAKVTQRLQDIAEAQDEDIMLNIAEKLGRVVLCST
jgi:hypothetical protein